MHRFLIVLVLVACAHASAPGVRYEPTAMDVVETMLQMAEVRAHDVVADLGCGDGRIVIEAVRRYGARGVCVDIDPRRLFSLCLGRRRIDFLTQDLFATYLREVRVVMLFLSPEFTLRLRPKLERELAPGSRVVSHWHDMGDWQATRTVRMRSDGRERPVYLWVLHGRR